MCLLSRSVTAIISSSSPPAAKESSTTMMIANKTKYASSRSSQSEGNTEGNNSRKLSKASTITFSLIAVLSAIITQQTPTITERENVTGKNSFFSMMEKSQHSHSIGATKVPSPQSLLKQQQQTRNRIAFGSCNKQDRVNNLWSVIESRNPTAFVWGGDAIYADDSSSSESTGSINWKTFPPEHKSECGTPDKIKRLYQQQLSNPSYKSFLQNMPNITIFGTIDDHDYGCNNADRTFEYKRESALAFTKFIHEDRVDSPIRRRAELGYGVYGVKVFDFNRLNGDELVSDIDANIDPDVAIVTNDSNNGEDVLPKYSNHSVAIFVLDCRTNKSPWKSGWGAYKPDTEGDFLGDKQWRWFEGALSKSKASVNIIVNGLQVHADRYLDANVAESWSKFPTTQKRLYGTILKSNVQSPILISGDVHMTQLMKKDCTSTKRSSQRGGSGSSSKSISHSKVPASTTRPLIELTTSGMTHSWGTPTNPLLLFDEEVEKRGEKNKKTDNYQNTYDWLVSRTIKSLTGALFITLAHLFCPWNDIVRTNKNNAEGKSGLQYSLDKNFGEIEFNWSDRTLTIRSIGEGSNNVLLSNTFSMDVLSYGYHYEEDYEIEQVRQVEEDKKIPVLDNDAATAAANTRWTTNTPKNKMNFNTTQLRVWPFSQSSQISSTISLVNEELAIESTRRTQQQRRPHAPYDVQGINEHETNNHEWICVNTRSGWFGTSKMEINPTFHMIGHIVAVVVWILLIPVPVYFILCKLCSHFWLIVNLNSNNT